jgi:hypothetical protein
MLVGMARFVRFQPSGELWYFGDDGVRVQHNDDGSVDIYDPAGRLIDHLSSWSATGTVPPLETTSGEPPSHEGRRPPLG